MLCSCPRDALCDRCVDDAFAQLRGVAANRGERWAVLVAARAAHKIGAPWPLESARMLAIAARWVADLSADARLRGQLRDELVRWAAKRWSEITVPL